MNPKHASAYAIQELLNVYIGNPLLLLRERAWQGRLISFIQAKLETPLAQVTIGRAPRLRYPANFQYATTGVMERTQPEVRCTPLTANEAIDVVVTGTKVQLMCYPHGPLDVVRTIDVKDLEVAIEIKASPSKNRGEIKKYGADIEKLRRIKNENEQVECHLVLIDKSVDLSDFGYGCLTGWNAGEKVSIEQVLSGCTAGVWVWSIAVGADGKPAISVSHQL